MTAYTMRLLRWLFTQCCTRLAVGVAFMVGSLTGLLHVTWWANALIFFGIGIVWGASEWLVPRMLSRRNGEVT